MLAPFSFSVVRRVRSAGLEQNSGSCSTCDMLIWPSVDAVVGDGVAWGFVNGFQILQSFRPSVKQGKHP